MKAAPLIALVALASSGCLFDEVQGIPCSSDKECPTSYFCDLPREECRATSDSEGVPDLFVGKVRDATGALVILPNVPVGETTRLGLQLKNTGKGAADAIGLTFAALDCVSFEVTADALPASVAGGGTVEVPVDATTHEGCEGVKIIDWFLTFSGRDRRGTFDMDILQAP